MKYKDKIIIYKLNGTQNWQVLSLILYTLNCQGMKGLNSQISQNYCFEIKEHNYYTSIQYILYKID